MLRRAHQRTHQLAQPRLWLNLMGLMLLVVVVVVASRSKNRQKVEESSKSPKKPQRSEKFAKVIGSEERLPKHRPSVNEELELPLKTLTVFRTLFAGPRALSIPRSQRLPTSKGSGAVDALSRFSLEEPGRSSSREHSSLSPAVTNGLSARKSLSAQRTSSLRCFSSGDALRKKTYQPRIRTEMLDGLGGCRGSCA